MAIKWYDQGLSRLHQHERDSFEHGVLEHRLDSAVGGGALFSNPDGVLHLRDHDGHDRIVGEASGIHHELMRNDVESEPMVMDRMTDDQIVARDAVLQHAPSPFATKTELDALSAKLDTILKALGVHESP